MVYGKTEISDGSFEHDQEAQVLKYKHTMQQQVHRVRIASNKDGLFLRAALRLFPVAFETLGGAAGIVHTVEGLEGVILAIPYG